MDMEKEIPKGNTREDIKARKQIISDFYADWCAEIISDFYADWCADHPEKRIWNKSLRAYIYVKYQSINETRGQASISYESTKALMDLTDILKNAIVTKKKPTKKNDKNQKAFDQMYFLYHRGIRLIVGHQKSTDEYVQYCITKNKASLGR